MTVAPWRNAIRDIAVPGVGSLTAGYRSWSEPAKTMALAIDAAVSAAQANDAAAFTEATDDLYRVDREQLAMLLGAVARELLERSHPDGLDSDDAEQLLQSCIRSAAAWYKPLDSDSLIRALTGALGISEPEESPQLDGAAVVSHGLLLIADQLTTHTQELATVLDSALAELMRAQTVELP
jgi:hypothetical protein